MAPSVSIWFRRRLGTPRTASQRAGWSVPTGPGTGSLRGPRSLCLYAIQVLGFSRKEGGRCGDLRGG